MNERLPYEQRLADKLNEVPLPDADSSWDRMKALLDRELPPGAGGGGDDGRLPGGRWWAFGVVIGVILIATWFSYYQGWLGNDRNRSMANSSKNADSSAEARAGTGGASGATSKGTSPDSNQSNTNDKNLLDQNTSSNNSAAASNSPDSEKINGAANSNSEAANTSAKGTKPGELTNENKSNTGEANATNANSIAKKNANPNKINNKPGVAAGAGLAVAGKGKGSLSTANKNRSVNQRYSNAGTKSKLNNSGNHLSGRGNGENDVAKNNANKHRGGKKTPHIVPGVQSIGSSGEDELDASDVNGSADNSLLAAHLSNKKRIRARAENISNPSEENEPADADHDKSKDAVGVVLGVALYQNFAISSNLSFNYNSSGNKGILMDYLPSVYGQYHFNNKMYIQAEVQFNMPQATPSLLLVHGEKETMVGGAGYHVYINTYLRKLYYFNIPVNFYYSPAKNFYLGAGLQFSSFNSGLALVEKNYSPLVAGTGGPYTESTVVKFKKDSLGSLLSHSEFRFMLDVNYNYRWFTAGLRLNQALKDYINLSFYGNMASQDKNESLQLYLRFNVWDGRKRGKSKTTSQ